MKNEDNAFLWATPIRMHIEECHNGNTSAFARTQDVSEGQARRWLKRGCIFVGGEVYCPISKQIKVEDK